jgi:hypothetical protein
MKLAGSASWRFERGNAQFLHIGLFVRDATGLAVPPSAGIPPRLAGDVPDLSAVLRASERAAAAAQWAIWWRRLLDHAVHEARRRQGQEDGQDAMARARAMGERQREIFDPPEFWSLAEMQPLRSAAVATFDDAVAWTSGSERSDQREQGSFAWPLVRDVAESTAAELGIPVGDLGAVMHVLDVQGSWSHLAGPGCGICSAMMADDPQAARLLLRDLFASGRGNAAAQL